VGNVSVHYVFKVQEDLVTVLRIGIKYVPNLPYEIELNKASDDVKNIINWASKFLCQMAISVTWAVLRAARENITVNCISKHLK
jgi:hypothetical protein